MYCKNVCSCIVQYKCKTSLSVSWQSSNLSILCSSQDQIAGLLPLTAVYERKEPAKQHFLINFKFKCLHQCVTNTSQITIFVHAKNATISRTTSCGMVQSHKLSPYSSTVRDRSNCICIVHLLVLLVIIGVPIIFFPPSKMKFAKFKLFGKCRECINDHSALSH